MRSIAHTGFFIGISGIVRRAPRLLPRWWRMWWFSGRMDASPDGAANNGMWSWGNEMVVAFTLGYHDDDKAESHPIKGPTTVRQARSLDGGETWAVEVPSFLDDGGNEPQPVDCPGNIDFHASGFRAAFPSRAAEFLLLDGPVA